MMTDERLSEIREQHKKASWCACKATEICLTCNDFKLFAVDDVERLLDEIDRLRAVVKGAREAIGKLADCSSDSAGGYCNDCGGHLHLLAAEWLVENPEAK